MEAKWVLLVNAKYVNFILCSLFEYVCQIISPTQNSINMNMSAIEKKRKNDSIWNENESDGKYKMSLTYQIWILAFTTSRSSNFLDETHHDNNELHFYDTQSMRFNLFSGYKMGWI